MSYPPPGQQNYQGYQAYPTGPSPGQQGYNPYPQPGQGGYPGPPGPYQQGPPGPQQGYNPYQQGPPGPYQQQGGPPQGPGQPGPPAPHKNHVVMFGEQYCLPYPTVLIMREKASFSMDDMDIFDVTGHLHFKLKAQALSVRDKRVIYDTRGHPVCCSFEKMFSIHNTTYICRGESFDHHHHLAQVKKTVFSFTPQLQVFLRGNESRNPDFEVNGNFSDRNFQIKTRGGMLMGAVSRDAFSARTVTTGLDTYQLQIMPGMDMAFMVMLVCIIEEVIVEQNE